MSPIASVPRALAVGLCLLEVAACGGSSDQESSEGSDVPAPPAGAIRATVERVVDGDTFLASTSGGSLRVRLIGINAPESVHPDGFVDCFGPEAAVALGLLLPPGTAISAAYETGGPVDQFGRQLWDVWLADGRFVQAELVRQGAAEGTRISTAHPARRSARPAGGRGPQRRRWLARSLLVTRAT